MSFSSMMFLSLFFPVVVIVNWLLPLSARRIWLVLASFLFCAWADPVSAVLLLTFSLAIYICGLLIGSSIKYRPVVLFAAICGSVLFLGYFKYANFLVDNIAFAFGVECSLAKIMLPIGISFYVFRAISYCIDVYKGNVCRECNPVSFILYMMFFPQMICGPIVRYGDFKFKGVDFSFMVKGLRRFIWGLGKKTVLANVLGSIADKTFSGDFASVSTSAAWIGAVAYSLQLFYDFSGYTDMAIGTGEMLGYKASENFNYPYISKTISEFWRRWHMTLSSWFRDYVYIPLGGNRVGVFRNCCNLFVVFLVTGIWHGANWTFVIWGMWHGLWIVIEKLFYARQVNNWGVAKRFLAHVGCLLVILFGWVLFRSDSLGAAWSYMLRMMGRDIGNGFQFGWQYYLDYPDMAVMGVSILLATPIMKMKRFRFLVDAGIISTAVSIVVLLLSAASIAGGTYKAFIYARF